MWVVSNNETGWSDESMRFGSLREAQLYVYDQEHSADNVAGHTFGMRYEYQEDEE